MLLIHNVLFKTSHLIFLRKYILNNITEKYNFCTIFDSVYFAKGLALYYSLSRVCYFHLYIFTPDKQCITFFEREKLPNITVIDFTEVEKSELLEVKSKRNTAEYYWTIKSSCLEYLFNKFNLGLLTYVDTDTFFYSTPKPFFEELGNNSVLITPHNFSPKYGKEIKKGIYNAGFISFRNNEFGKKALDWWKDKCIEWCYIKKEDEKFGDQMYLNTLSKFDGVHTLKHRGALANWNVQQYKFLKANDSVIGITNTNEKFEVIFYHFHYLKFLKSGEVELGRKYLSKEVIDLFYKPYINFLLELAPFELQGLRSKSFSWKTPILFLKRKIEKTYNIIPVSDLRDISN